MPAHPIRPKAKPHRRHFLFAWLIGLALVFVLTLAAGRTPAGWLAFDRLLHFAGFAVVGALAVLALPGWLSFLAVAGVVALGVVTEIFQNSVLGRAPDPVDLYANIMGAMTGALVIYAVLGIAGWWRRRRANADDERRQIELAAGDVLFHEGDTSRELYIVLEGEIEIVKDNEGTGMVIGLVRPREVFGEMACIQGRPRYAAARARVDTVVYSLSPDELIDAVDTVQFPLMAILRNLVDRLRQQNDKLADLAALTAQAAAAGDARSKVTLKPHSIMLKTLMPAELPIERFPFSIGRRRRDNEKAIAAVDLMIDDAPPVRISRCHFQLKRLGNKLLITDELSKLGTDVNGTRIGKFERSNVAELKPGANLVTVGGVDSPYTFQIEVR